jgi:hypothetical protein
VRVRLLSGAAARRTAVASAAPVCHVAIAAAGAHRTGDSNSARRAPAQCWPAGCHGQARAAGERHSAALSAKLANSWHVELSRADHVDSEPSGESGDSSVTLAGTARRAACPSRQTSRAVQRRDLLRRHAARLHRVVGARNERQRQVAANAGQQERRANLACRQRQLFAMSHGNAISVYGSVRARARRWPRSGALPSNSSGACRSV